MEKEYFIYISPIVYIYIYTKKCYSALKKNEIIPFAAMDQEINTLCKSDRERQISYDIT